MNHCALPNHVPENTGLPFQIFFYFKDGLWFVLDLNPNQLLTFHLQA